MKTSPAIYSVESHRAINEPNFIASRAETDNRKKSVKWIDTERKSGITTPVQQPSSKAAAKVTTTMTTANSQERPHLVRSIMKTRPSHSSLEVVRMQSPTFGPVNEGYHSGVVPIRDSFNASSGRGLQPSQLTAQLISIRFDSPEPSLKKRSVQFQPNPIILSKGQTAQDGGSRGKLQTPEEPHPKNLTIEENELAISSEASETDPSSSESYHSQTEASRKLEQLVAQQGRSPMPKASLRRGNQVIARDSIEFRKDKTYLEQVINDFDRQITPAQTVNKVRREDILFKEEKTKKPPETTTASSKALTRAANELFQSTPAPVGPSSRKLFNVCTINSERQGNSSKHHATKTLKKFPYNDVAQSIFNQNLSLKGSQRQTSSLPRLQASPERAYGQNKAIKISSHQSTNNSNTALLSQAKQMLFSKLSLEENAYRNISTMQIAQSLRLGHKESGMQNRYRSSSTLEGSGQYRTDYKTPTKQNQPVITSSAPQHLLRSKTPLKTTSTFQALPPTSTSHAGSSTAMTIKDELQASGNLRESALRSLISQRGSLQPIELQQQSQSSLSTSQAFRLNRKAIQHIKMNRLKETSQDPSPLSSSQRLPIFEARSEQKLPLIKRKMTNTEQTEKGQLRELQSQFSRKVAGANMILLQGRAAMKESEALIARLKNEL